MIVIADQFIGLMGSGPSFLEGQGGSMIFSNGSHGRSDFPRCFEDHLFIKGFLFLFRGLLDSYILFEGSAIKQRIGNLGNQGKSLTAG